MQQDATRSDERSGGAKIVLTTVGTLGDLHPFIAIALALKERGHRPLMAVPEDHLAKVRAAGLDGVAILPSFDTIRQHMGLAEDAAVKRAMSNQVYMLEEVVLPWLTSSTEALSRVAADADVLVASLFVFGSPTVAEKDDVPLVSVILQPMALLSIHAPPHTPDFWMTKGFPRTSAGVAWNRMIFSLLRGLMRRRYTPAIDRMRADHGLPPTTDPCMFEIGRQTALTLCCYSPVFGPRPIDAPANTEIVGFPVFDSESGGADEPDPELAAFLAAGPPPLVFTLGSFAVHAPGNFYAEAAAAARQLGQRAVLLTGPGSTLRSDDQILVRAYAPHSTVFRHALAIIHHGGIGTVGQALRAGKPQLVVPHMGDQSDNAERIRRMGLGQVLRARRFTADRAVRRIAQLIDPRRSYGAEAARVGAIVAAEHGAHDAALAIEQVIAGAPSSETV
jgi:UDP:flavonoid glycosyltransferase YjiC (YdhE family)